MKTKLFMLLTTALTVLAATPSVDDAFEQLKTYDDGQGTAILNVIEQQVGRASGDAAQKRAMAARLSALLSAPGTTPAAQLFICQQLRLVGGHEQVPALAKMLDDARTADMARLVLQNLPGDAAGKALIAALDRAKGRELIGVINSLGDRREATAVKPLARFLADPDAQLAGATALALGRISTPEAADALAAVRPAAALQSVFIEAKLTCAQRLAPTASSAKAAGIYRELLASNPPRKVRQAALGGWAGVAGEPALPALAEAMQDQDEALAAFAVEQVRRLHGPPAAAALQQALAKATGPTPILLLGAIAERGDEPAVRELTKLSSAADPAVRADATRELRRLRYAAVPNVIAGLEETTEAEAATGLSPAPYAASVIEQRRKEIAAKLATNDKLLAYLDCGAETSASDPSGVGIRQINGQGWHYPGSEQAGPATAGTVAFDGAEVRFEITGLDPKKTCVVGLTWWDFDDNGRIQSITFSGGQPRQTETVLKDTKLPNCRTAKQGPATITLPVATKWLAEGKLRIGVRRRAASNVVIGELWVLEAQPGSPAAAGPRLDGAALAEEKPAPPVDLTAPAEGTKVLIVTGIDYPGHKWKETSPVIKHLLEQDPRLKVRIVEDPEALASPKLKDWNVVLLHFQNWETPGPGAAARENLKNYVAGGGGLGSVHFACGAWHGEWPEFQNLLGRVWHGSGPGKPQHDALGQFLVEIVDQEHPVTKGLANFETTDELYTCLTGDAPIHLLAQAKSKVDQKYHPQAFVREYGKGRVFLTTLGHDVRAYTNNPAVGELLRRGCAWAAGAAPARP